MINLYENEHGVCVVPRSLSAARAAELHRSGELRAVDYARLSMAARTAVDVEIEVAVGARLRRGVARFAGVEVVS